MRFELRAFAPSRMRSSMRRRRVAAAGMPAPPPPRTTPRYYTITPQAVIRGENFAGCFVPVG